MWNIWKIPYVFMLGVFVSSGIMLHLQLHDINLHEINIGYWPQSVSPSN